MYFRAVCFTSAAIATAMAITIATKVLKLVAFTSQLFSQRFDFKLIDPCSPGLCLPCLPWDLSVSLSQERIKALWVNSPRLTSLADCRNRGRDR